MASVSVSSVVLDGLRLVVLVLFIPIAILAIGAPFALAVKLLLMLIAML
jgi:hypothetical protein